MRLRAPAFWWSPDSALAGLLAPAAWIYAAIAERRLQQPPRHVSRLPVICVGNFVAGGAGKTPVTLALAEMLLEDGKRPGVVSRGFGGRMPGPVIVDPAIHCAQDVGDEPLLLANRALTIVAKDRVAGARAMEREAVDCILLDDGFQNPSLRKDQSWVVVDGAVGIGNGKCIPAGPLRARLEWQLPRAHRVVVMGGGAGRDAMARLCERAGIVMVQACLEPVIEESLRGPGLLAYCGIGRPEKFFDTLTRAGLRVAHRASFADHHGFTEADARRLLQKARADGLTPVTTEKDFVRLAHVSGGAQKELAALSRVVPVRCRFEDRDSVARDLRAVFD